MISFELQLSEIGKEIKEFVESEKMKEIQNYCKIISNIRRLGKECNWVVVTPDVNTNIVDENETEINHYFVSLINDNPNLYNNIRNEIVSCNYMENKLELVKQVFEAIEQGHYYIACIALSTILEFLLAKESDFNSIKIPILLNNFINNVGDISIREYKCITRN